MRIQSLETIAPKPLVECKPVGDLADSARVEATFPKLAIAPLRDEGGALKNPQVPRNGGKRYGKRLREFRYRRFAAGETREDRAPGGV